MTLTEYYGRLVLVNRHQPEIAGVTTLKTITREGAVVRCGRCGQVTPVHEAALPGGEFYCPQCINLGRVSTLCKFYHVPEANQFELKKPVLTWNGKLSPLQARAAKQVADRMVAHQSQLLWAVTGAGKTEMMFPGIAAALARGERLAVASPRVDVCLELYPRLRAAFANTEMALLHGRAERPYHYAQLTVCTTHQLLRFYHAFDNLIIDEVDAFPYAANPLLFYASRQAVKKTGGRLFLTATPDATLQGAVRQRKLAVTYLPLRFHGHLLPTIHCHLARRWRVQLRHQQMPSQLVQVMRSALRKQHRFLLFVPHVKDLAPAAAAVHRYFTSQSFATVHASDPARLTKVQAMRDGQYQFLITTSILERGVTFPEIDVFVLGADDAVFSTAALVQIAGRAGRSASRPTGRVEFWVADHCRRVNQAVRQVAYMNNKGRRCQDAVPAL